MSEKDGRENHWIELVDLDNGGLLKFWSPVAVPVVEQCRYDFSAEMMGRIGKGGSFYLQMKRLGQVSELYIV